MSQRELGFSEDDPEDAGPTIQTVSELVAAIGGWLEPKFRGVCVEGEISNLARPRSGHVYFTLKDARAQLRSVIYRATAQRLPFRLEDGLAVVATGNLSVYPARGEMQLVLNKLEPRGVGSLELAFRQRVESLRAEGLFDPRHKQRLPECPRRVGFVTSPTGAAVQDFLRVLKRRFPGTDVLILPVRVQGEAAAGEIAKAVAFADRHRAALGLEALAVGRGGGSLEDLWAFNEEVVARAIFAARLPVVSCVGHEVDVTIADLVADVRAATPSEAAELLVPSGEDVLAMVTERGERLNAAMRRLLENGRHRLARLEAATSLVRARERLARHGEWLSSLEQRLTTATRKRIEGASARLAQQAAALEALSPLAVLGRGYSLTQDTDGRVLRRSRDVAAGDTITTRLAEGRLVSRVERIDP